MASQFLTQIQVLQCIVVFVLLKMCEACMLHSRVIVQALRWDVEIATQQCYFYIFLSFYYYYFLLNATKI